MSLKEAQLGNQTAVFNEWIAKHQKLKPFTQEGMPRTIRADDLTGFKKPDETWLSQTRQQRGRVGSATPSTYTVVQFSNNDVTDVVSALQAGKNAKGTTRVIPLHIAWEQAVEATNAPAPWKCASITIKLP
jgi:hypothetical protein